MVKDFIHGSDMIGPEFYRDHNEHSLYDGMIWHDTVWGVLQIALKDIKWLKV